MRLRAYLCRSIARLLGELGEPRVWWCSPENYRRPMLYKDATVEILADADWPSLEVNMFLPHHNPVLCVDRTGRTYRSHGEWHLLEPHIKKIAKPDKPRTAEETLWFIGWWSDWFYRHSQTYDGALGRQLAYLWPAIVRGEKIEVTGRCAITKLLRAHVGEFDPIWNYVDVR